MAWFLSPSGWPTQAVDGSLFADSLSARGWAPLAESQVQAAIDAYNAGTAPPPAADFVTVAELQDQDSAASAALRAAYGTDVGDLQRTELDGVYAATIHGHTAAAITDWTEAVQDAVAAFFGVVPGQVTYDDTAGSITILGTGGTFDPEATRDAIGAALIGAGLIAVAVNDAGDTITISTTATANATDAQLRDRATHTGTQAVSTLATTGTPSGTTFLRGDSVWATPPGGSPADASETVKGIVELATVAETATGTDSTRAVTPAAIGASLGQIVQVDQYGAVGDGVAVDTAAINAAIAALPAAGGVLSFGAGRTYKTAGGHVLPVGTRVIAPAATISHTGNNVCLNFNQTGGFNIDKPTGVWGLRLIGNSGTAAVGVEVGNCWGFHIDGDIDGYTAGRGLLLNNVTNWCEGVDIDRLKIDSCAVGLQFRRSTGTSSFGYTRIRDLSINVPANGIGIDLGGDSASTVYLYNSDLEANVWLNGNNATAFRVGPTVNTDNLRLFITGENPTGGALTGLTGLKNNEGGTLKGFGHLLVKNSVNALSGGFTRILSAGPRVDAATGTDATAGDTFLSWLVANEDLSHDAIIGYITGSNRSIPFVAGYNAGDAFRVYSTGFGQTPATADLRFTVTKDGDLFLGTTETGIIIGTGDPETTRWGNSGTVYLRTDGPAGWTVFVKEQDNNNNGWAPVGGSVRTNAQTGTTYTPVAADANKVVELTNAAAITLTVPPNSTVAYPIGTVIKLSQFGAGQVTVAPGAGVTIRSRGARLKLAAQYAQAELLKRGTNEWVLSGDVVV